MKVAGTQLDLSLEMDSKLDALTAMMSKLSASGASDPADMDPKVPHRSVT